MNYPAMLLFALMLGAAGAALGNAIEERNVFKCALRGLATGAFTVTAYYLYYVVVGNPLPH